MAELLRTAITRAYHESHCGKPVTCDMPHMSSCQGTLYPDELDAILKAVRKHYKSKGKHA